MGKFGMIARTTNLRATPTGRGFELFGGAKVKSLQRGIASMSYNVGTVNVSITGVDLSKAVVIISQHGTSYDSSSTARYFYVRGRLTSPTNLELQRYAYNVSGQDIDLIAWTVIEFEGIKGVQYGLADLIGTSVSVAINTVDTTKTLLFFSYQTSNDQVSTPYGSILVAGRLASSTQITFSRRSSTGYIYIAWYILEF